MLRMSIYLLPFLLFLNACGADPAGEVAPEPDAISDGKADGADPADCVFDPQDPFEPRARLPKGPARGRCYDTRQHRPVVRLEGDVAGAFGGASPETLVVANVFHDGAFWVARIPRSGVETVIFQLEYFPAIVPAGHTQLRVRFRQDAPVVLLGQTPRTRASRVEIRDLVLSVEALGQLGYKYDLVEGVLDNFGAVYRMTSLEAKVVHMLIEQDHRVEQWPLALEPAEKRAILEHIAADSEARGLGTMYNTLFVNCTNEIVRILDSAVTYTAREQVQRFLAKVTEFYPNVIRTALIARGLLPLDQSTDLPELAVDPTIADMLGRLRGR